MSFYAEIQWLYGDNSWQREQKYGKLRKGLRLIIQLEMILYGKVKYWGIEENDGTGAGWRDRGADPQGNLSSGCTCPRGWTM